MAHPYDSLDLLCGAGQQHGLRDDAKICQPITLVSLQFFPRCDQAAVPGDGAEFLESNRAAPPSQFPGQVARSDS